MKALATPLVAVAFTLVPLTVRADTIVPGSACQSASNHGNYALSFSMVRNESTTLPLQVDCPIAGPAESGFILIATLRVRDQHPSADFVCNFTSLLDNATGPAGTVHTKRSSGSSATPQGLGFTGHGTLPTLFHFIGCSIPPVSGGLRSEIVAYSHFLFD